MIDIETYKKLEDTYGQCASWAIWKEPKPDKPASNTECLSFFNDENICDKLNSKYVFVGLNKSKTHNDFKSEPWRNFHSIESHQKDFKLRYALTGTKFWGSYMTDIIKICDGDSKKSEETKSEKVMSYLKKHPEVIDENIEIFKEELNILSNEKPILIAIGKDAYHILENNMKEYTIIEITHYSTWMSKENYKEEVHEKLKDI